MSSNSLSYYLNRSKLLTISDKENIKSVSILSNYTLQGLSEVLKIMSYDEKSFIEVYEGPYNQFRQEILDSSSGWHASKSDLTFIILDLDSFLGNSKFEFHFWNLKQKNEFIEQTKLDLKDIIFHAIKNQFGKVVISNFPLPTSSPFGIFDYKINPSLLSLVYELNLLILEECQRNNSLFCLDMNSFFNTYGRANLINEKLKFLGDMKISSHYIPVLAKFMLNFIIPLCGKTRKCLVLDLDNTIWGGIIGEDGINGIKLDNKPPGNVYVEFQKEILGLHQRGIILAINSKNNLNDVMDVFSNHPNMILHKEHFASIQINWNDKANNLIEISKDLNIGLDSLVFWDDDPVNRDLVRQQLPEVYVPEVPKDPSEYSNSLKNLVVFHTFQITEEDKLKGKMYAEQYKRQELQKKSSNLDDFLKSLSMNIIVKKADNFLIPRLSQLTLKTNQFNLTTKRYSEEQIKNMIHNPNYLIKTFSVSDRFGDNGLTGLYIIDKHEPQKWFIDSFLMSCRIMGRNIEDVMFYDLLQEAKNNNVQTLVGKYFPTKKNMLTENLYANWSFSRVDENTFELENISNIDKSKPSFVKLIY